MNKNYKKTKLACYMGFITQAITANFVPLLYLTFYKMYEISLAKIAMISTTFFVTQLIVGGTRSCNAFFCSRYHAG